MLVRVTGFLWGFVWFRLLVIVLVRRYPGPVAGWLSVNTPLLASLHFVFIRDGDFASAASLVREAREYRGVWWCP